MGLLDSLFQPGTQEQILPEYIERPSQEIGNRISNIIRRPGQRTFNPFQQEGVNALIEQARAGNPFLAGSTDFLTNLFQSGGLGGPETDLAGVLASGGAINPAAAETARIAFGGELGQNPFLESQFNRAADVVGENFRENIIPGLDTEYATAGRSGGLRYAGERNRAEDAYGRQINDLANEVFGGAYNADLARRDAALGNLGNLGQQDVTNRLAGAGLFQEGRQNIFAGLDRTGTVDASRFADPTRLFEAGGLVQRQPFSTLQLGADILGRLRAPTTTVETPNPFSQLLGAGTSIAAAYAGRPGAGASSDAGLKRDVVPIGHLPSGLPVYCFKYRWDDEPQIGVMAHEVLPLFPTAVSADAAGRLMVDYARIG